MANYQSSASSLSNFCLLTNIARRRTNLLYFGRIRSIYSEQVENTEDWVKVANIQTAENLNTLNNLNVQQSRTMLGHSVTDPMGGRVGGCGDDGALISEWTTFCCRADSYILHGASSSPILRDSRARWRRSSETPSWTHRVHGSGFPASSSWRAPDIRHRSYFQCSA